MTTDIRNVPAALDEDLKVREYISKLADLRSTGITRVNDLKQQIIATKKSRMLSDEAKAKMIEDCRKQIAVAQEDALAPDLQQLLGRIDGAEVARALGCRLLVVRRARGLHVGDKATVYLWHAQFASS